MSWIPSRPIARSSRPVRRQTLAAVLIGTGLLLSAPAEARNKAPAAPAEAPEIADKQADLQELRGRIESLRRDLAASEGDKADAADRLRESERSISGLQRELHRLARQQGELQNRVADLARQSRELEATLGQQRSQLEKLLYRQYLRGNPDSLQLLLNGDDPNQMARDLHYLAAIARTRAELLGEINGTLARQRTLATDTRARAEELAGVEVAQREQRAELEQQRQERKALLAQVSDRVRGQRREIGNLERNEKRLSQLIDRLSRLLAAQAAQAAKAARTKPPRLADNGIEKGPEPTRGRTVEAENQHLPQATQGNFGRLRGNLRLPVRGAVAGRFGAPREGGGTWKGLFIRTAAGSEVKAVANGRVVYAEWMRGFGNLMIVDHGDAYLSIYGNNDSLLKQVGEAVQGGETVATVGNSGGNPESGLYFELRHQGQPIDPMKWASLK